MASTLDNRGQRSSPRSTRSTTSIFLREENRPRSVFAFAMDTSVHQGAVCPNGVSKEIVGRRRMYLSNSVMSPREFRRFSMSR